MLEREVMIHNEQVKLTTNFLSRFGFIAAFAGLLLVLFAPVATLGVVVFASVAISIGIGLNVLAFFYLGKLR